jgi:hypothetical protein
MQSLCITTYDVRSIPALGRCARYNIYFSGVRVARSLVFCLVLNRSLFVLFRLPIVVSVFRFKDYDYPFGILQLFLL